MRGTAPWRRLIMREIKFRAWDDAHKKMFTNTQDDIVNLDGVDCTFISMANGNSEQWKLMQYTGLAQ
jgi:hypothetical protein